MMNLMEEPSSFCAGKTDTALLLADGKDFKILCANQAFRKLFGLGEQALQDRSFLEFIDAANWSKLQNARELLSQDPTTQVSFRLTCTDGLQGNHPSKWLFTAELDESGDFLGIRISQASEDVEQSYQKDSLNNPRLMDQIPLAVLLIDLSGKIVDINERARIVFEPLTPESKTAHLYDLLPHFSDRQAAEELFRHLLDTGSYHALLELAGNKYRGTFLDIEGRQQKSSDGKIIGFILTAATVSSDSAKARSEGEAERKILENIKIGVVLQDAQSRILSCNQAAVNILGLKPDQIKGLSSFDKRWKAVHEDGSPFPGEEHPAPLALKTGLPQYNVVMGVRKPDDSLRWLTVDAQPVFERGEDQPPTLVICSFADITAIKEAEQALRISEQRWKFALEGSGDGVWEYHLPTGRIFYSAQYKKMLGFAEDEFPDEESSWRSRIHPDDLQRVLETEQRYTSTSYSTHNIEYRIKNRQGEYIWVNDSGMVTERDLAGKPVRITGTQKDISERKATELSLTQKLDQFRSLSKNLPGAIYEYAFHRDGSSGFVYVSDSLEKLFDISAQDFTTGFDFIHPDDLPRLQEINRLSQLTNQPFHFEGRLITPDGKIKWHETTSSFSYENEEGSRIFTGIITDITERKQAEKLLKENEARFRALFNSTFQFIGLLEPDGTVIEANQAFLDFGGVEEEEVIRKPLWETYWWQSSENSRRRLKEAVEKAAKGAFVRYEEEILDKERNQILIDFSIKPVKNDRGDIILLIPEGRDIHAQRLAEKELLKTSEQLISFLENSPAMNWIMDDAGHLLYMNALFLEGYRLTENDMGRSVHELLSPDLAEQFIRENEAVWQSGQTRRSLEFREFPDGNKSVLQVVRFPIQEGNGPRLLGGNALDITEIVQNNEALEKSNERFFYVNKATSDAIWDWDVETNRVYRGEGFKNIFGYSHQGAENSFDLERVHPGDRERVEKELSLALNGFKNRWELEYRYQCQDGTFKVVTDKAYIIRGQEGKAIRVIGAMQDVTEQRRLEKELLEEKERRKHEVMEAVIQAQERERQEISNELHDNVNQILSSGKLFLEMAARQTENSITYIRQGEENIQMAIEEIRRISHGLNTSGLELVGLQSSIRDLVARINSADSISVQYTYPEEDPAHPPDPDVELAVFRIAQEQVSNILKHASASLVKIQLSYPEDLIVLQISDNGRGFDVENTRKGLGLHNILNRAEHYGGKAELISAPGKGCALRVILPASKREYP